MKFSFSALVGAALAASFLGCAPMEPAEAQVTVSAQPNMNCNMEHKDVACDVKPAKPIKPSCGCSSEQVYKQECVCEKETALLTPYEDLRISVVGQGVAPTNTVSPAQAYALAKRAAISDAYRLLAEKIKGVRVEGQDLIKNMMVQRSTIQTYVDASIRNAHIVETNFKEGLCEVEMELVLSHAPFTR